MLTYDVFRQIITDLDPDYDVTDLVEYWDQYVAGDMDLETVVKTVLERKRIRRRAFLGEALHD